jgi:hypothetical protein
LTYAYFYLLIQILIAIPINISILVKPVNRYPMKSIVGNKTIVSILLLCTWTAACNKSTNPTDTGNNNQGNHSAADSVYNPMDPSLPPTIGFFNDNWTEKSFSIPLTIPGVVPGSPVTDSLLIDLNKVLVKVPPSVYGNNSNLWMGQIVTQPALMQYIKDMSPHIIRAPAGSVSDLYFWNGTDANPAPADAPANLPDATGNPVAANYWHGGNDASWTFSLSNYYALLAQTNSMGLITVNYGYARYGTSPDPVAAAAHLAADWVRYDNGRTKYWEIGNETYGSWEAGYQIDIAQNKDGQPALISGDLYGRHVKIFIDSMSAAAHQTGATIYIGATLYDKAPASYDYASIQNWNKGVLQQAGSSPDFYIVHDYFTPYAANSSVDDILNSANSVPVTVMNYCKTQMQTAGLPVKPIALTEWNIEATGSRQNVSFIAGIHAVKSIGAIIKNQFGEASRWDLANGWSNGDDQGMFNIGDEPGATPWNPRPAFYYLYYFQQFFGDRMVQDVLKTSNTDIATYSSSFSSGQAGTVIINSGTQSHTVSIDFLHFQAGSKYYWYVLTGGTDHGNFSGQVFVNGTAPSGNSGGPLNYAGIKAYSAILNGTIKVSVPPLGVVFLVADKK